MSDIAGAVAGLSPDNVIRVGTVTSTSPLKVNVGGGIVEDAGTLGHVATGDRVACVRQGQTWLVLGVVHPASAVPAAPGDADAVFNETVTIQPPASSGSVAIQFNHGYALYVDNTGTGGVAGRVWLDGPDFGELVIGPRSGATNFESIRFRTHRVTGSAANAHLDASNILYKSSSSLRYKVNVESIDFDREALMQLRPIRFQDKREFEEQGEAARPYVGLVAEEVHALGLTEFVFYDEEGRPDGVQYERLGVALLGIVKDLAARVAALEKGV